VKRLLLRLASTDRMNLRRIDPPHH